MVDVFSKEKSSEIMARVKSCHTKTEIKVRKWLHQQGYRFRLHKRDLPGNPDIILSKHKTIIFVHGCFWHRHNGCKRASTPQSNEEIWRSKFERNVYRDEKNLKQLKDLGWKVLVVWECEVDNGTFKNKIIF